MLYPDFKLRYSCLGQAAIKSSEDNKTAVYALMDGVPFDRERYRLGKKGRTILHPSWKIFRTHPCLLPRRLSWSP